MSTTTCKTLDPVLLWSNKAPGALGDGTEDRPRLAPYLIEGGEARACVVVCPGGGYHNRAPHEAEPIAQWLNGLGVAACVLHYRVAPYSHPAPLRDAMRAIRLVRFHARQWNIDPKRVGILGFSAGGHLATSAATLFHLPLGDEKDPIDQLSARPDALIACYPVITGGINAHSGTMRQILGANPTPALQRMLSLEHSVTANTPPTFLWHTADDQAVPVENSLLFAEALARHGVRFALHVFASGTHGLGLAASSPTVRTWTDLCGQWLADIGFRPR